VQEDAQQDDQHHRGEQHLLVGDAFFERDQREHDGGQIARTEYRTPDPPPEVGI
jgi:hypothetical protein